MTVQTGAPDPGCVCPPFSEVLCVCVWTHAVSTAAKKHVDTRQNGSLAKLTGNAQISATVHSALCAAQSLKTSTMMMSIHILFSFKANRCLLEIN